MKKSWRLFSIGALAALVNVVRLYVGIQLRRQAGGAAAETAGSREAANRGDR